MKKHAVLNERWLQNVIARDPSILGLGDVYLHERERIQTGAGRIDLLLQDSEEPRRFEVEIQLGQVDESHIIRTIEYWDLERRRFPGYEHTAVIVAEEITGRFLNVISLFNRAIPLIALQVKAIDLGEGRAGLVFTRVLDTITATQDDDDGPRDEVDRAYWEQKAKRQTLEMVDECLKIVRGFDPALALKYNKYYIGLARNGQPDNFVTFQPQQQAVKVKIRIERSEDRDGLIAEGELDLHKYDDQKEKYELRLRSDDIRKERAMSVLGRLMRDAFERSNSD